MYLHGTVIFLLDFVVILVAERNPRFPAYPVEFRSEAPNIRAREKTCVAGNGCPGKCVSRCKTVATASLSKCEGSFFTPSEVCCPPSNTTDFEFVNEPDCGKLPNVHYVVGGIDSERHSKPWMVQLYQVNPKKPAERQYICTSSLINKQYVLTAAHCVVRSGRTLSAKNFVVKLGAHSFSDGEFHEVVDVVAHENYRDLQHYNDIALIKLTKPVTYNNEVRPLCLPTPAMKAQSSFVGEPVVVSGWGTTSYGGSLPKNLMEADVYVMDTENCSKNYKEMPGSYFMLPRGIDNTMICAGLENGGKDTCQGDSGGPLVYMKPRRAYQLGVVSFGYKCAEPGFPGVYTNLLHHSKWVACKMQG